MIKMPELKIGDLTARIPIIQGGMGVGISLSKLAAAVANEGGIGVISSVGLGLMKSKFAKRFRWANKELLKQEIRRAKRKTNGIIGLNIMVAISDFDDIVKVAVDEKVDIIFLGAGLPLKLPGTIDREKFESINTKIAPIISSARAANIILKTWDKNFSRVPDAFVVEGPLAGGHLGFKKEQIEDKEYDLEKLVPQILAAIAIYEEKYQKKIPLIAAGGIYSGADIHKFLQLGAQGIQMGSRFVATKECDASKKFKQAFVDCKKEDIVIIDSPVGLPGRAIVNKFLHEVSDGIRKPFSCPWKCLKTCDFKKTPYCIARALSQARAGKMRNGFAFAGANAYKINKIISVRSLLLSLQKEYIAAVNNFQMNPMLSVYL
jgi:nitronate monooxygenase